MKIVNEKENEIGWLKYKDNKSTGKWVEKASICVNGVAISPRQWTTKQKSTLNNNNTQLNWINNLKYNHQMEEEKAPSHTYI